MKIIITNNELDLENGIELSLQEKFSILENANQSLEKDLDDFIIKIKDYKDAHHLWATSWTPLRLDDLEGLALYYFIIEIIKYLRERSYNEKIILEGEFDTYFLKYVSKNYPKLSINRKFTLSYHRKVFGQILNPVRYIFKVIFQKKYKGKIMGDIWMSSPLDINKHRYKHLLNKITYTKAFYTGRLDAIVNSNNIGNSLDFINYLNFKDVLISLKKAKRLNKVKNKLDKIELVDYAIANNKLQQLAATILKERSVANAIKVNKPKKILFTTANTYPSARIIARQAYLNQIPFIIVACRPMFTKTRLEERLIHADQLKINDAHVADNYAVWDEYSKQTLINQGVNPNSIYVISPSSSQKTEIKARKEIKNALLILCTHEESLNQKLIEELSLLNTSMDIILRQHPLKSLNKSQYKLLSDKFNIIMDITSKDYSNFEFINVIALTINSTAILEAVSHGCGAIWMPYLNSRSLLFFEIMNTLGIVVNDIQKLELLINQKIDERKALITSSQKDYQDKFKTGDETLEFLQQMKLT